MIYLYWTVVVIGWILVPIIAGVMFHKSSQKYSYFKPDGFEYAMMSMLGVILVLIWPLALPIAAVIAVGYLLFKLPQRIMEKRESK